MSEMERTRGWEGAPFSREVAAFTLDAVSAAVAAIHVARREVANWYFMVNVVCFC